MLGPVIILVALVVIMPVSVLMSGALASALLGWSVKTEVDRNHQDSELLETNG